MQTLTGLYDSYDIAAQIVGDLEAPSPLLVARMLIALRDMLAASRSPTTCEAMP